MKTNNPLLQTTRKQITAAIFTCILLLAFVQTAISQNWATKHAMSPAAYQEEYNNMKAKGLKLASITGYTKNGQELYAAIWNKKATADIATHHGMSADFYKNKVDEYRKLGYKVKCISGYAVNGTAKFAAIWEKNARAPWEEKHDMSGEEYQAAVNSFDKQGYRLNFVNGYVVNGKELFAAVWEKTTGGDQVSRHNLTAAKYQEDYNEWTGKGYRLKVVSGYEKNGTDLFAAIWEKIPGPHGYSRHGISRFNYQHVVDNMYYQGYEPVYIDAYAANGTDNYNVIWENTNMKASDLATLDAAVKNYMTDQDVKGMSVAVTKDGRLVYAKGFGYADPETKEELCPTHSMRVMSISKSVTGVAIMKLMEQKKLNSLDRKVFGAGSILGDVYATPKGQEWLNDITVRSFLHHTSGMRSGNGEPPFNDATATHDDAAKHLLGRTDLQDSIPHKKYEYSNLGYFWLMMVIEKLSGQSYETYIRNNVLTPSGIGQSMYVGLATGAIKPGEVHYTPHSNWNMNNYAGFGGWVARPMDLLKFLGHFDGQATPPDLITKATYDTMMKTTPLRSSRAMGWVISGGNQGHRGALGACYSTFAEIGDGYSIAVIINSPYKDDKSLDKMHNGFRDAVKAVSAFPSYNLF